MNQHVPFMDINREIREYQIAHGYEYASIEEFKNKVVHVTKRKKDMTLFYFDNNGIYQELCSIPYDKIQTEVHEINRTEQVKKYMQSKKKHHSRYECIVDMLFHHIWIDNQKIEWITTFNRYAYSRINSDKSNYSVLQPLMIENVCISPKILNAALRCFIPTQHTIYDIATEYNNIVKHIRKVREEQDIKKDYNPSETYAIAFDRYYSEDNRTIYISHHSASCTDKFLMEQTEIPKEVKNFIYRIDKPRFERTIDNKNTKTFDFIRIRLSIPSKEHIPNRKQFIEMNQEHIARIAINKIQSTKAFSKYGIPTNFLRLENMSILQADEIELVYGLKPDSMK